MSHAPLTDTDREQLDDLILRGARHLTHAETDRLLVLWERHRIDAAQARRTAGGLTRQMGQLREQLATAETRMTAVRNLCSLLTPEPDEEQPFRLGQAHAARTVLASLDSPADGPSQPS